MRKNKFITMFYTSCIMGHSKYCKINNQSLFSFLCIFQKLKIFAKVCLKTRPLLLDVDWFYPKFPFLEPLLHIFKNAFCFIEPLIYYKITHFVFNMKHLFIYKCVYISYLECVKLMFCVLIFLQCFF